MRISDWSSDVCSSDLQQAAAVTFAGMIVVGGEGRGDALGAQQLAGDPGVLAGDAVGAAQHVERPPADVAEVADGRRHQVEADGSAPYCYSNPALRVTPPP